MLCLHKNGCHEGNTSVWLWCLSDVTKEELLTVKLEMQDRLVDRELDKKTEDDRTLMTGQQTTHIDHEITVSGSAGGGDFVSSDIVALRSNEAANIDDVNLHTERLKQDPDVVDETQSLKQSQNVADVVADETQSLKQSQNVTDDVVDEKQSLKPSSNVADSVGDNVVDETQSLKQSQNIADDVADDVSGPSETRKSSCQRLCDVLSPLVSGWRTYARQSVVFAGLSLAMLYMTVLGFDSITVG